jgi:uncharacterized membrane protein
MPDDASRRENSTRPAVSTPLRILAASALLLTGAIFGFFYAYSVSVMWGLDAAAPRSAIDAMQGINRVIRNAAFAPAFFGTPLVLAASAVLAFATTSRRAAFWFSMAAVAYFAGALLPTFLVNVPMNDGLAVQTVPAATDEAAKVWHTYSTRWIVWNHIRTATSGVALLFAGSALYTLGRKSQPI